MSYNYFQQTTDNTGGGTTVNLTVANLTSTSQLYGAISYIDSV